MTETVPLIGITIWVIAKIFVIIVLGLYLVFALVVVRQVQLMTDTVEMGFEIPLKLVSFLHFVFAVGVLILAIIIL